MYARDALHRPLQVEQQQPSHQDSSLRASCLRGATVRAVCGWLPGGMMHACTPPVFRVQQQPGLHSNLGQQPSELLPLPQHVG